MLTTQGVVTIRGMKSEDIQQVREILAEASVFSEGELAVANELIDEYLNNEHQHDYECYIAIDDGDIVGYACLGLSPLTHGVYDLYWIVVKHEQQRHGIGNLLVEFVEQSVAARSGRLIVAETSSTTPYDKARRFYLKHGYGEQARIKDYYKDGDDLVIYGKYLFPKK